jgi:hypothetical protein
MYDVTVSPRDGVIQCIGIVDIGGGEEGRRLIAASVTVVALAMFIGPAAAQPRQSRWTHRPLAHRPRPGFAVLSSHSASVT